jgi:hypothetical protein
MGCAVVQDVTNIVVNMIVADPSDPPPEGCFLVDITDKACDIGWIYDPVTQTFSPPVQ